MPRQEYRPNGCDPQGSKVIYPGQRPSTNEYWYPPRTNGARYPYEHSLAPPAIMLCVRTSGLLPETAPKLSLDWQSIPQNPRRRCSLLPVAV